MYYVSLYAAIEIHVKLFIDCGDTITEEDAMN